MGWYFSRQTRDQLIRELIEPQESESARSEVIAHALRGNVLWSVVRITAKQSGFMKLAAGDSINVIRCDLLQGSGGEWGHKPLDESMHPYYYSCPLRYLDMAPVQSPSGGKACSPITHVGACRRQWPEHGRYVMDPILASLPASLLRLVEDQLSNNEVSSDEELLDHFISDGLTEEQARQALTYRNQYLANLYLDGFTPILKGSEALRFNPYSRQFEPE